mmetsp:Transcript_55276/g.131964  ORF Transcript_55276/g.131964 Transcript_55276/m.131964 type:complete len:207 (+) Transcript_55276:1104-1724(+)
MPPPRLSQWSALLKYIAHVPCLSASVDPEAAACPQTEYLPRAAVPAPSPPPTHSADVSSVLRTPSARQAASLPLQPSSPTRRGMPLPLQAWHGQGQEAPPALLFEARPGAGHAELPLPLQSSAWPWPTSSAEARAPPPESEAWESASPALPAGLPAPHPSPQPHLLPAGPALRPVAARAQTPPAQLVHVARTGTRSWHRATGAACP